MEVGLTIVPLAPRLMFAFMMPWASGSSWPAPMHAPTVSPSLSDSGSLGTERPTSTASGTPLLCALKRTLSGAFTMVERVPPLMRADGTSSCAHACTSNMTSPSAARIWASTPGLSSSSRSSASSGRPPLSHALIAAL
eukprot:scaffold260185_cov33-Tisochrysis_lutea.AAC.5